MTLDLWILVACAALQWTLVMAAAWPRLQTNGFAWGMGNRNAASVTMPPWAQRTQRASDNLHENLILFAILVLVVHVAGKANDISAMGAEVFFGARLLHAALYIAGVPVLRTIVWAISIAGLVMIASALF